MVNDKLVEPPKQTVGLAKLTAVAAKVVVTVTNCVVVAVSPAPSVTVHVTVLAPNGKVILVAAVPFIGVVPVALHVTEATVQLSAVVGAVNVTVAEQEAAFTGTVKGATMPIVGAILSTTVTAVVQVC